MKSLKSEQFVYLRHFFLMFKVFRHNGRQHIYFNCFYGFVSPTEDPLVFFTVVWCTEYFNSFFTVLFYYYLLFLVF